MNDTLCPQTKKYLKKCWNFGDVTLVTIDERIVKYLAIDESTVVEQEITQDGILMRIRRQKFGGGY
jgi:hypothetical protein